ncbi:MAG: hypothetical protein ABIT10_01300 [Alteraurantiacibacter sp.]
MPTDTPSDQTGFDAPLTTAEGLSAPRVTQSDFANATDIGAAPTEPTYPIERDASEPAPPAETPEPDAPAETPPLVAPPETPVPSEPTPVEPPPSQPDELPPMPNPASPPQPDELPPVDPVVQ